MDALAIDSMDYSQQRAHQGGEEGAAVISAFPRPGPMPRRQKGKDLSQAHRAFPPPTGTRVRACGARVNLL